MNKGNRGWDGLAIRKSNMHYRYTVSKDLGENTEGRADSHSGGKKKKAGNKVTWNTQEGFCWKKKVCDLETKMSQSIDKI